MQLSEPVAKALNDQINLELASAHAYLGMAAWFDHQSFSGFSAWMKLQGTEELGHARKFFDYVIDRGGRVSLDALPQPRQDFQSPLDAFQASLAHEQRVSSAICSIYDLAGQHKDFATQSFLKWFLDEQVEEERTVAGMISSLQLIGESKAGLYQLDRQAGRRAGTEGK